MLKVKNINTYYGPMHILKDVSLEVNEGEIIAIIGANGAGKSTTLRSIVGLTPPKSGEVWFKGKRIDNLATHNILQQGIVLIPEGRRVFPHMSVLENLKMGAFIVKDTKAINERIERTWSIFPRLLERKDQLAGTLSGGEQQMLSIARGLMSEPEMIIFDEPSLGLAPVLIDRVVETILELSKMGKTVLLVEQSAYLALEISHRAYVLETGRITLQGLSSELLDNEDVKKAYLA